jgi:AcrR family transcriptional regulator
MMVGRGRRPGGEDTRQAIMNEARREFGDRGYRASTLRSIAAAAGVDPRLILHFFGSKKSLFIESVELPIDARAVSERVFAAGRDEVGQRAAELMLSILNQEEARRTITGLLRAAVSEPEAAELIRELLSARLLMPIAQRLGDDRPELRASLVASLFIGITMGRHVVGLPPLVAATSAELAAAIGPVIQHYLVGDWTGRPTGQG